jgi:gluconate 5-dehydrogenase
MSVLDQFRLDGKRALVTGGSKGLGLEMARALADAGAKIVIVGRDAATLTQAATDLERPGRPGGS